MEENKFNISDELLEKLSVEKLVDLKIEVDELSRKLEDILETCDEALNM